ncbi:MAG: hypothetical protein OXU23_04965, partial [Candidatus Poribacteria bacterium]|nr:hypothetical protein [Candidatus Poribacteria bacterium]
DERLSEIETNRSPSNERGHGIFIVKTLSDMHEMQPNEAGGTDVRVVFHFPKPSDIKNLILPRNFNSNKR